MPATRIRATPNQSPMGDNSSKPTTGDRTSSDHPKKDPDGNNGQQKHGSGAGRSPATRTRAANNPAPGRRRTRTTKSRPANRIRWTPAEKAPAATPVPEKRVASLRTPRDKTPQVAKGRAGADPGRNQAEEHTGRRTGKRPGQAGWRCG